jgi:hypothetical protein
MVVVAELVPADAELIHVEALGRTTRRIFAVDEDFHLSHSPMAVRTLMPPYPEVGRVCEPVVRVSPEVVAELCGSDEVPAMVTARPSDDWFVASDRHGAAAPRVVDDDEDPFGGRLERLTETAVTAVRAAMVEIGPLAEVRVGAFGADAASGEWGHVELVGSRRRVVAPADALASLAEVCIEVGAASADLVALMPGASVAPARHPDKLQEIHLPLSATTGPAGLATANGVAAFEFATPVLAPGSAPRQIFNDGREELRLLRVLLDAPSGDLPGRASPHPGRWPWSVRRRARRART